MKTAYASAEWGVKPRSPPELTTLLGVAERPEGCWQADLRL
ncbi:hypothetical protein ACP6NG_12860 [Brevibacterium casei]